MTQQSLSSVTLATIENYRSAANQAARAYRVGGQRLVVALNSSMTQNIDGRVAKLAPEFSSSMLKARSRVTDIVVKGIDQVASRTEKAVDLGSDGVAKQVTKVAAFAASIENPMVVNGLQTATRLSMPGAKLALVVSGKVADGAKALSKAAQGKAVKASVSRVAAPAKRKAAAVSRKAVKTVRAAVAAPKKAVVRAKRKLAA